MFYLSLTTVPYCQCTGRRCQATGRTVLVLLHICKDEKKYQIMTFKVKLNYLKKLRQVVQVDKYYYLLTVYKYKYKYRKGSSKYT